MTKLRALAFAAALAFTLTDAKADYLITTPTVAAPNTVLQQVYSGTFNGKILNLHEQVDANGNPFGTLANPTSMQFGTGVTLPSFAAPQHFICDSGCGGGGGGGLSVLFGGAIGLNGTPGGYKDGSGNFQPLLGDTSNGLWVSVKASATIPVTGTFWPYTLGQQLSAGSVPVVLPAAQITALTPPTSVGISGTLPAFAATPTVNLGTIAGVATAANQTATAAPLSGAATATNSSLAGGVFNSSPITLTNTQQAALQIDANGFLKVNIAAGAAAGGTSSTFGAAFPSVGTAGGMSVGGNMVALTGTGSNLNVQCANCSGSGASAVDEVSFTAGSSVLAPGGGFFQTTATSNPLTTGQQGMVQMTANRAFFVNLRGTTGTALGEAAAPLQVSLANTGANATAVKVDGSGATQPVSGTVTANLGTLNGAATAANQASVIGSLSGGTSGTSSLLAGGVFNSGALSLTTGQQASLQLDSAANLKVNVATGSVSVTGSVAVTNAGTFAVQLSGATNNINNIAGTVSLPTGAATSALQPTNAAIASTTAGQTGRLTMGAVTTAAPSYTTAQTDPLSLTTAGALRVDGSGVTQPVSLTSTTITGTVAVTQSGAWSLTANQSVNVAQINGVTPLMGNGVAGTGSQRVTIASDNTAFAVNATLQASATTAIGKVDPNTIGNWGLQAATQNSATPTNGGLVLGQFNTTPTTITSGNVSPLQMDNAGNLLVNIKAGSSSGAVAQGSTTSGQSGGLTQAAVSTSAPTYTTATTNPLSMDTAGNLRVLVSNTNLNIGTNADAVAAAATSVSPVGSFEFVFNGSTFDRKRSGGTLGGTIVNGGAAGGSAVSGNPVLVAGSDGTNARTIATDTSGHILPTSDPCTYLLKHNFNISQTSSGNIITGAGGKKNYICSLHYSVSAAANVSIVEYSGTCTGGTPNVLDGSSTAANGPAFSANGGMTFGNGGASALSGGDNANTGYNVCALQNGTATISGGGTYVQL